jgi:hypothetical protein
MRPWFVVATQVLGIPLAIVWGVLHELPPLDDDTKPTLSCVDPEG